MTQAVLDTRFTAAQAEQITGVTQALQRDWRRRGFIGEKEGTRASYTAEDLAYLMALHGLAGSGVRPSVAQEMARSAAALIYIQALSEPGAVLPEGAVHVARGPGQRPPKYLVSVDWAPPCWAQSLDEIVTRTGAGRVIAISIEHIARELVQRAGGPLKYLVDQS